MKKPIQIQPKVIKTTTITDLDTAFGKIHIGPSSVGTASISQVSDKEFIQEMKKASKEDLFSSPDAYGR